MIYVAHASPLSDVSQFNEFALQQHFKKLLSRLRFVLVGNDFRPDYRKLGILRQQFPDVPIMALTATATASVVQDVTEILKIQGCEVFRNSVDRPNLYYEVKQKPNGDAALAEDIATWIQSNFSAGEAGLVYCLTKKDCEALTTELMQRGIAAACYHADIEAQDRLEVHDSWTRGVLQVICCTVAFGMGVNHTAVRFVIHHTMSKSVEVMSVCVGDCDIWLSWWSPNTEKSIQLTIFTFSFIACIELLPRIWTSWSRWQTRALSVVL
jgi:hypothetical protein